jgi:Na+/melibiose symporter-like transporter
MVLAMFGYIQPTPEEPNPEQPAFAKLGIQVLLYLVPFLCFYLSAFIIPKVPVARIKELKKDKIKTQ